MREKGPLKVKMKAIDPQKVPRDYESLNLALRPMLHCSWVAPWSSGERRGLEV